MLVPVLVTLDDTVALGPLSGLPAPLVQLPAANVVVGQLIRGEHTGHGANCRPQQLQRRHNDFCIPRPPFRFDFHYLLDNGLDRKRREKPRSLVHKLVRRHGLHTSLLLSAASFFNSYL